MTNAELIEKKMKINELLFSVDFPPMFRQFFDPDSNRLLDEKIEVLTALNNGIQIADIPKFYDVLELYPEENTHWD